MSTILDNLSLIPDDSDTRSFHIADCKILETVSVPVENLRRMTYETIQFVAKYNFTASPDLNKKVLNLINNYSIDPKRMENIIFWTMKKMSGFDPFNDSVCTLMILDCTICLLSSFAQKESYIYRKVTNSPKFNKSQFVDHLEKILTEHPYFPARGNAFVLLASLDHIEPSIIYSSLDTLMDENLVKEYVLQAIPMIDLSSLNFVDDILETFNDEGAMKVFHILKIIVQQILSERLNEANKSKLITTITDQVNQSKSKKVINYFYTDVKIPFTTTLEIEFYESWLKIQGLSGKINSQTRRRRRK